VVVDAINAAADAADTSTEDAEAAAQAEYDRDTYPPHEPPTRATERALAERYAAVHKRWAAARMSRALVHGVIGELRETCGFGPPWAALLVFHALVGSLRDGGAPGAVIEAVEVVCDAFAQEIEDRGLAPEIVNRLYMKVVER
jgi:hypothetical protein